MSPGPHSIPNMLGPKAGLSYVGLRFLIMCHENKRSLVIFFFLVGVGGRVEASKSFFQSCMKGQQINLFKKELLLLIQGKSLETCPSASMLSPCWGDS